MLAMRKGERVNIITEEAREDGLDAKKREAKAALSPCIQLGTFQAGTATGTRTRCSSGTRSAAAQHDPAAGLRRVRKIVSVSGWAKHGVLYEFVSLAERNKHFPNHEKGLPKDEAFTDRLVRKLLHAPGSPNVAQRIAFTL